MLPCSIRRFLPALAMALTLPLLAASPGVGAESKPADKSGDSDSPINNSGLPVPRFVTLRSAEVNLRTGPGVKYPVEWVFVRREMPVEITAEYDTWRRIRDWEGTEGWVHQSMLSGKRAVLITGAVRTLRHDPAATAGAVAQVEPGAMGKLLHCRADWCQVDIAGYRGWLARSEFWGVYPQEAVD